MAKYCPLKDGTALYPECLECQEKLCKETITRVIIAGSRQYTNYDTVLHAMTELAGNIPKNNLEIVSGHASGVDSLGEMFARRNHIRLKLFPADWNKYGKKAGPLRNREMAEYASRCKGILLLIWDGTSRGSASMKREALAKNLTIKEVFI